MAEWKSFAAKAQEQRAEFTRQGQALQAKMPPGSLSPDALAFYEKAEACKEFARHCREMEQKGIPCFIS